MITIEKQKHRVITLSEMMVEELNEYLGKKAKYEAWAKKEPKDYFYYPETPNAESLKRIMLMVRKETIKMEKML